MHFFLLYNCSKTFILIYYWINCLPYLYNQWKVKIKIFKTLFYKHFFYVLHDIQYLYTVFFFIQNNIIRPVSKFHEFHTMLPKLPISSYLTDNQMSQIVFLFYHTQNNEIIQINWFKTWGYIQYLQVLFLDKNTDIYISSSRPLKYSDITSILCAIQKGLLWMKNFRLYLHSNHI